MKDKEDWFKNRNYLHITNKVNDSRLLQEYVSNKVKVATHSFSPLIFKEIKERRFKKSTNANGLENRKHTEIKNGAKKSTSKKRPILYATHIDAHIYSYYTKKILQPLYEKIVKRNNNLNESITAYRQILSEKSSVFKNNVHFANDSFKEIKSRGECIALTFDITNFFPSLNHEILKKAWSKILDTKTLPKDHYNVFKSATNFSYIKLKHLRKINGHFDEKHISVNKKNGVHGFFRNYEDFLNSGTQIYKNEQRSLFRQGKSVGIPQGLPISALLANIYLLNFDIRVVSDLVEKQGVFYRRYSDDIIIICELSQLQYVTNFVTNEMRRLELEISPEKTEKFHFKIHENKLRICNSDNELDASKFPLTYLGFEFDGEKIRLKSKNLAGFYREMKQSLKRKSKRAEVKQADLTLEKKILYKRKLYRLYSFKGIKKRTIVKNSRTRIYRGNYIKYAYRASELMDAPEIKRQVRNHWRILQREIKKMNFDN